MAVAQGYGKTVTSGSVFAYDVADIANSYKGGIFDKTIHDDEFSCRNIVNSSIKPSWFI